MIDTPQPRPQRGAVDADRVFAIERPEAALMTYYALASLLLGPLFFLALIPLYFRYHTLHYRFDEEGVAMGWGILFRREVHLTYARIQDIHLTSNLVERWLGLGRVQIQTASGSAAAEMTIEGRKDFEAIRDFLYARMRGMRESGEVVAETAAVSGAVGPVGAAPPPAVPTGGGGDELAAALREVAGELREVRRLLAARGDGEAAAVGDREGGAPGGLPRGAAAPGVGAAGTDREDGG